MSPLRKGRITIPVRPHKVNVMRNGQTGKWKARCPQCEWESQEYDTQDEAETEAKTHGRLA